MTHLRIEKDDTLFLVGSDMHVCINNTDEVYSVNDIEKMVLITTDLGPLYDDMGLAIEVGDNKVIFIMSGHKCFQDFLFDQIGKHLLVDYEKVIEASTCIENDIFVIYKRDNWSAINIKS